MEIEQNINAENHQQEVPPREEKEEPKRDRWVIVLNIVLALITILLLGYIAYKNGYINLDNLFNLDKEVSEESDPSESDEIIIEENGDTVLLPFEGDFLSAVLPEEWSIEEYSNGEGTDMLVEGVTYVGLTGLRVFHGEKEIIHIGAVSGIGFVGCPELPLFDDSDPAYTTEMEEINTEVGMTMSTLDYTSSEYTDFEWFGKDFRRIGFSLYYDSVQGNDYFDPQCEKSLFTVPGFSFEDSDGYEGTAYFYDINDEATDEELGVLDNILASMEN